MYVKRSKITNCLRTEKHSLDITYNMELVSVVILFTDMFIFSTDGNKLSHRVCALNQQI